MAEPADSPSRFDTPSPPSSSYPRQLAGSLSVCTLDLYASLTSHGACSHIAAIASTHIAELHTYNFSLSCASTLLCLFRPAPLEVRIVPATDPHQTIPDHNPLWSKVTAWSWGPNVIHFGYQLRGLSPVMDRFLETFEHSAGGPSDKRDFWRSGSVFGRQSHPARIRS